MGRLPCCDKAGVKKGPWTPEEDIILVSYIQEHGPGNWRAVPGNTWLLRCSKSCRLRWANYLRPGIRRGNFTEHEEKMIVHLQALLGNRWAAIASYLPQRTDNDIKNYWNTHLKKKLAKKQQGLDSKTPQFANPSVPRGQWERRLQADVQMAKKALFEALSLNKSGPGPNPCTETTQNFSFSVPEPHNTKYPPAVYAYSTENISRLLGNWMKKSPSSPQSEATISKSLNYSSYSDSVDTANLTPDTGIYQGESKPYFDAEMLEKWLFEDTAQEQEGDFIDMYSLEESC